MWCVVLGVLIHCLNAGVSVPHVNYYWPTHYYEFGWLGALQPVLVSSGAMTILQKTIMITIPEYIWQSSCALQLAYVRVEVYNPAAKPLVTLVGGVVRVQYRRDQRSAGFFSVWAAHAPRCAAPAALATAPPAPLAPIPPSAAADLRSADHNLKDEHLEQQQGQQDNGRTFNSSEHIESIEQTVTNVTVLKTSEVWSNTSKEELHSKVEDDSNLRTGQLHSKEDKNLDETNEKEDYDPSSIDTAELVPSDSEDATTEKTNSKEKVPEQEKPQWKLKKPFKAKAKPPTPRSDATNSTGAKPTASGKTQLLIDYPLGAK